MVVEKQTCSIPLKYACTLRSMFCPVQEINTYSLGSGISVLAVNLSNSHHDSYETSLLLKMIQGGSTPYTKAHFNHRSKYDYLMKNSVVLPNIFKCLPLLRYK